MAPDILLMGMFGRRSRLRRLAGAQSVFIARRSSLEMLFALLVPTLPLIRATRVAIWTVILCALETDCFGFAQRASKNYKKCQS
jgi:hypothetical protein